jgi:hypothetical protein
MMFHPVIEQAIIPTPGVDKTGEPVLAKKRILKRARAAVSMDAAARMIELDSGADARNRRIVKS